MRGTLPVRMSVTLSVKSTKSRSRREVVVVLRSVVKPVSTLESEII